MWLSVPATSNPNEPVTVARMASIPLDAILDRLVNNAYRLELTGKSMRGNGARRAVADPVGDEIGEQSK